MHRNDAVVLAAIRAVEDRDRETLFSLYHDEVVFHEAGSLPYGGTMRGRGALLRQLEEHPEQTWLGTWDPLQPTGAERRLDPRVIGTAGDEVVVLYRQRALSPGGERFESAVLALYEVRDEQLARAQMFHYDTAAILAFLDRARGDLRA